MEDFVEKVSVEANELISEGNKIKSIKSEDGCEEPNYIWDGEEWLQVEYGQGLNSSVEYTTDFQV